MSDDDETDWSTYESEPFCRHWDDAYDCDICKAGCATCGHSGLDHSYSDPGACDECDCKTWVEKPPVVSERKD